MQTTIWTVLVVAAMLLNTTVSLSQSLGPSTLRAAVDATDGAEIDALYGPRPPMLRMWNWGGALNGVNSDLQMNGWHIDYPFTWTPPTNTDPQTSIRRLIPGARLTMAPSWNIPGSMYKDTTPGASEFPWFTGAFIEDTTIDDNRPWLNFDIGHGSTSSLIEAQGMRFEPELEFTDTNVFVPRTGDRQRGVWGFLKRDHGTTSNDTTNANFSRYSLTAASVGSWDTVLTNSWPQQEFCEWQKDRQLEQMRSFNGHLMFLGVNLRRTDTTDTLMDSTQILRLRVHYQLADGAVGLIRFDSLPAPNVATANIPLPTRLDGHGRGLARPLIARPSVVVTEMVVTRGMLPRGDAADSLRDVTIQGHVKLVPEQVHGTVADEENFYLRNRQRLGLPIGLSGDTDSGRIIRIWVEVEYNGRSDIAIDWVQLGTENYTWFTQGYHDEIILDGYRAMADGLTQWNSAQAANASENIRIWRWFNRDEGPAAYWNGMHYMHELFDNRTTTELNLLDERPWWVDRYLYATGITNVWEGHTARITNQGLAPYYLHGNGGMSNLGKSSYYHRFGRRSIVYPRTDTADYDLLYFTDTSRTLRLPITALPTTLSESDYYPLGLNTPQSGLQSMIEHNRYLQMRDASYLFRDDLDWIPNLWLSADYTTITDAADGNNDTMFVNIRSQVRHLTGEEVRLLSWSELILGAKGLVYYWGANPDSVASSRLISQPGDGTFQSYGIAYGPVSHTMRALTAGVIDTVLRFPTLDTATNIVAAITRTNQLASYGARDVRVGGDWLDSTNSTGLWHIMNANGVPVTSALSFLNTTASPGQFYLGWQSIRSAMQSVHEVITAGENDLDSLHLKAWCHRGFRTWNRGDTTLLDYPVNADSVRTRHPLRDKAKALWTWDSPDSTFVELTVLQDKTIPLHDRFVVGVLNRRASPFLYDTTYIPGSDTNHVNLDTFFTYHQQFSAIAGDPTKTTRYRQAGARMVEIPFRYRHPDGLWRNLRVEAIGVTTDTSQGIAALDTVIGQDTKLWLKLMPGEGVMLKVTPLPAHTNDPSFGYLDHSNQRKLVAYPKVDTLLPFTDTVDGRSYLRQVNGDTMWYHRVYHRRRDDTAGGGTSIGILSVYYQRSQPVVNAFDASTITWEDPILLSDAVVVRQNGVAVDTTDFSCGYPSIVVRFDQTDPVLKAKVYVVFACEFDRTEGFERVLIAEAVLPAQSTRADQVSYLTAMPAEGLEIVPAPDEPMLQHWGTPMINASYAGNYYCWSHGTQGIGIGFKLPNERQFAVGPNVLRKTYLPKTLGDVASHPSLNSYSRLHLGETDAAMVWQEGDAPDSGRVILYTRLHVVNDTLQYFYKPDTSWFIKGPLLLNLLDTNSAVLAGTSPVIDSVAAASAIHCFPALYRHLSDWPTDASSWRHPLRLVNHKAERAVWQTRPFDEYHDPGRWVIGRRVLDISEWTINTPAVDTIWSQGDNYIFSEEFDLLQPDIAQGEQLKDMDSGPPSPTDWYTFDDSTLVMEFSSQTTDTDLMPKMWSLTSGYQTFYGQDQNHDHADLITDGLLRAISGHGRVPHLAARYSMLANQGWQRNRRIYNRPGGTWDGGYTDAPGLSTSSQYFFKEEVDGPSVHGFVYRGVRARNGAALLGPIWVESLQQWVAATTTSGTVATPWLQLETIDDIAVMTKAWCDDEMVGELFIERKSDGERFNVYAVARNQNDKVARRAHTLLSDPEDRYRFVLVPTDKETWPAEDVELATERSLQFAKGGQRSILDLRTMQHRVTEGALTAYPNPARDRLTVLVDLDAAPPSGAATVRLLGMNGEVVWEQRCQTIDIIHLDLTHLASGAYQLMVIGPAGETHTKPINIIR